MKRVYHVSAPGIVYKLFKIEFLSIPTIVWTASFLESLGFTCDVVNNVPGCSLPAQEWLRLEVDREDEDSSSLNLLDILTEEGDEEDVTIFNNLLVSGQIVVFFKDQH